MGSWMAGAPFLRHAATLTTSTCRISLRKADNISCVSCRYVLAKLWKITRSVRVLSLAWRVATKLITCCPGLRVDASVWYEPTKGCDYIFSLAVSATGTGNPRSRAGNSACTITILKASTMNMSNSVPSWLDVCAWRGQAETCGRYCGRLLLCPQEWLWLFRPMGSQTNG